MARVGPRFPVQRVQHHVAGPYVHVHVCYVCVVCVLCVVCVVCARRTRFGSCGLGFGAVTEHRTQKGGSRYPTVLALTVTKTHMYHTYTRTHAHARAHAHMHTRIHARAHLQ